MIAFLERFSYNIIGLLSGFALLFILVRPRKH